MPEIAAPVAVQSDPARAAGQPDSDERRAEPRLPGSGTVLLRETEPVVREFHGELVDVSENGFRARFAAGVPSPECGASYRFEHFNLLRFAFRQGSARVAWLRNQDGVVEAGFFVSR